MFGLEAIGPVADLIKVGLEKIFPDPVKRAEAQRLLEEAEARGDLDRLQAQLSVMLEEAKSQDKWTSRARPGFLYVMYILILSAIPMGIAYAISPQTASAIAQGLQAWLEAIPGNLYALFGVGYLGYVGGRSFDKDRRLRALVRLGNGG